MAAAACATALSVTPAFQSGMRTLMAEVGLVANDALIMGGTGTRYRICRTSRACTRST